jgi:hypothetical protein
MAIPPQFTFANEADFTAQFLIPLLRQLGFSIACDYHGAREFGKDLIFGEIDHFGHVRYDALQAKYQPNLGLNDVETLISDCRQAFANPFRHPHTGAIEQISTFYAVNAGTFSDQAREHFFNSLRQHHGGNIRLIDGKGLLRLDQGAAASSRPILADLNGLALEIEYNQKLAANLNKKFREYTETSDSPVPINRFRLYATSAHLQHPPIIEGLPALNIEAYWEVTSVSNGLLDHGRGPTRKEAIASTVKGVIDLLPQLTQIGDDLLQRIRCVLQSLGPLTGV